MATLYEITKWDELFEKAATRKLRLPLKYVLLSTNHDGLTYRRLMRREDALELLGAWVCILTCAAKCEVRGVLADATGQPLTPSDIADITGAPTATVERAMQLFSSADFAWIIGREWEKSGAVLYGTVPNDTEPTAGVPAVCSERSSPSDSPPATDASDPLKAAQTSEPTEFVFPLRKPGATWMLDASKLAEYVAAYPGLDVETELRKARQWCRDNVTKRKSGGRGMLRFLASWLNRACDRGGPAAAPGFRPSVDPDSFPKE